MKKYNSKFFLLALISIISVFALFINIEPADAARGGRGAPVASASRKSSVPAKASVENTPVEEETEEIVETIVETVSSYNDDEDEDEPTQITNKSSQFAGALSSSSSSFDSSKSDLAEKIRKQREALDARDRADAFASNQKNAMKSGKNSCDTGLRECMIKKCGSDFSKCALDGDTIFGDKLNLCRKDIACTGEEFRLFTTEIKADRDLNAQLSSYTKVVECGNKYNDCMQKECGATFNKCLGKAFADRAAKNCETIAKNCMEQDSGLSARFGTAIGKLRESAEKEVKVDEERMYKLRDDMRAQCQHLGAMFDERSFDCVYTVNFFAGRDQDTPTASRKAYAGNSFTCMQEWFGVNVTTFKENAYRETRAQSAASSAMLGSGVGTAAGLISSGAIGRALDTQKAKKALKNECKAQGGKLKKGECAGIESEEEETPAPQPEEETPAPQPETPTPGPETPDTRNDAEKLADHVKNTDTATLQQEQFHNNIEKTRQETLDKMTKPQLGLDAQLNNHVGTKPLTAPTTTTPSGFSLRPTPTTFNNSLSIGTGSPASAGK